MPNISIAMGTYNGEKFLQEQLDSLAAQILRPHELIVGDDGSSDSTLEILEAFARNAPFPVLIHRNPTTLGFADNFLATAARCSGDWIAFCDQDDVWFPNRLSDCAAAIDRADGDTVLLLQTALLALEDLGPDGRTFPKLPQKLRKPRGSQYGFWAWAGFLQTVRADLIHEIPWQDRPRNYYPLDPRITHDKWTCMLANALGTTAYLSRPAAYYRRHTAAVTGSYARTSAGERVRRARGVGAAHYRFLAEVARDCAESFRNLAASPHQIERQRRFREAQLAFVSLAETQDARAGIYEAEALSGRVRSYLRLWELGGYVGSSFVAMGPMSAAKDAIQVLAPSMVEGRVGPLRKNQPEHERIG